MSEQKDFLDGKTVYVVSDLHMGDGSDKDNFRDYQERFEDFLAGVVEPDPAGALVLAGDVFDFWQSRHGEIVRRYLDLLRRLVALNGLFIVGNHDIDLMGFVGIPLRSPLVQYLVKEVRLGRKGKRIRICHGHEFDRFNDPNRAQFIGHVAALVAGEAEMKLGTKIGGESTEKLLEAVARGVMMCGAAMYRGFFNKTAGEKADRGKEIDETKKALDDYHAASPDVLVVAGHTHKAGWYGGWYVNSGSWQGPEAHYVQIAPDGEIALHKWPGRELVETHLWQEKTLP